MGFNAPETDNLLINSRRTSFCVRSVSSQYFFNCSASFSETRIKTCFTVTLPFLNCYHIDSTIERFYADRLPL